MISHPTCQPSPANLRQRLRAMPSSLNDACRTMEEAADLFEAMSDPKCFTDIVEAALRRVLDDIEVEDGKCRWADVANILPYVRGELRDVAQAEQEPVAWHVEGMRQGRTQTWYYWKSEWPTIHEEQGDKVTPLYAAPQPTTAAYTEKEPSVEVDETSPTIDIAWRDEGRSFCIVVCQSKLVGIVSTIDPPRSGVVWTVPLPNGLIKIDPSAMSSTEGK